jgi:hypothetical protein
MANRIALTLQILILLIALVSGEPHVLPELYSSNESKTFVIYRRQGRLINFDLNIIYTQGKCAILFAVYYLYTSHKILCCINWPSCVAKYDAIRSITHARR